MINFIKKIFATRENQYQEDNIGEDFFLETNIAEFHTDLPNEYNNNIESNIPFPIIFNQNNLSQIIKEYHFQEAGTNFKFFAWQIKEGEWVEEGTPLYGICNSISYAYGAFNPICANKRGVIEYFKKSNDDIKNGEIVGYIHPIGTFQKENLTTNNTYYYYFNINNFEFPNEFLYDYNGFLSIKPILTSKPFEWNKDDNEFVSKGDLIFSFEYEYGDLSDRKGEKGIRFHYAEKEGYIDINKNANNGFNDLNQLMYKIMPDYNQLFKQKYKNEPSIQIDDFNDSVKINWKTVGGYIDHYEIPSDTTIGGVILNTDDGRSFIFSFEFYEGKDYLVFYYSIKDFKISIGNKISFLFEDNIKHTFNVIEKPIRCKIIGSKLYETKVQITSDELKSFSSKNLLKWKIEDTVNNTSFICEAKNHYWYTKDLLQAVTKNLASEYTNLVLENDINYSPLIERDELKSVSRDSNEECYVYLMIDTTNNFHKIGISNNPKYREKTLQSDKPTIELLHKKSFPNRRIAEVLEKTLHITYSSKRIRGEWFDLDNDEINEIIIMLN